MKVLSFPIECKCNIRINKFGSYELILNNLPHPSEGGAHSITTTGRTLGEAFFNMGHYSMLSFEELFPGFLDEAVAEVLYPQRSV